MRSGAHVDPLTRHSPALRSRGRIIRRPPWGRVKLAPIHNVSSWKFSRFSAWLCAGATVVCSFFEFRSVSSRLNRSSGFSIGGVRSFVACVQSVWRKFEFFRLFGCLRGNGVFSVKLRFSSRVCGVLEVLAQFLELSPVDR